ncbi:MAG: ABC transporter permease [Candidatus Acidiferrales bacterium]
MRWPWRKRDEELDEEIRAHIEMSTREREERGVATDEARTAARREFGNVGLVKETTRDTWPWVWAERLGKDVRYGLRTMRRSPGSTIVAVLTLALGIGATTAIFSVVYGAILSPLPYRDPDKLVLVSSMLRGNRDQVSPADYLDWKRESTVFQDLDATIYTRAALSDSNGAEEVGIWYGTPGVIEMLGLRMFLGRGFLPEEGEPGKDHVVDLSYEMWRDRFGSDPNILGKTLRLDRVPYTVIGVFQPAPTDREVNSRLGAPLSFASAQTRRDDHTLVVQGRLKPGVTVAQANAEMRTIVERIDQAYPETSKGWGVSVQPLANAWLDSDLRSSLLLLMTAVGFVLLIACANVANLLLAQGAARQREIAVRGALGATRGQVIQQFLTESLSLAAIGAALGIVLAWGLLKIVMVLVPQYALPMDKPIGLEYPVLLFSLALTVLSSVLFGSAPAWQAARLDLNGALKEGGRSAIGMRRNWLRRALVVVEFALALTLLAGGGLAIHSFLKLANADLGFRKDHVLTFYLPLPQAQLKTPKLIASYYRQFLEKISALPSVTAATAATGMPVYGSGFQLSFSIAGQASGESSSRPLVGFSMVTPEYFETFGVPIDRGRAFSEQDIAGGAHVAIVSEQFVRQYLSGAAPLTQSIIVGEVVPGANGPGAPIEWQIVGVSHDVRNRSLRNIDLPEMYVPFSQSPWPSAEIAVRTAGDPASVSTSIAGIVHSMDPDLPMADVETMDQIVEDSMGSVRFEALLFGGFSGVALLLAALGIYGVMAFEVEQRTHEIGLRMALGAGRAQVLVLIMKDGMIRAIAGLGLGFVGAFFVGRAMQSRLYGIGAIDPVALGGVAAALLGAALLACYVPARRATRLDPMVALRDE